jgi:hypothetical protein
MEKSRRLAVFVCPHAAFRAFHTLPIAARWFIIPPWLYCKLPFLAQSTD